MEKTSAAVLLAALVLLAGCISGGETKGVSTTLASTTTLGETPILAVAEASEAVSAFVKENPGYKYEITVLNPEELPALAEKYAAVYGGLPQKIVYRVDYSAGSRGMLVIVDLEEKKVLKQFRTVGVTLT